MAFMITLLLKLWDWILTLAAYVAAVVFIALDVRRDEPAATLVPNYNTLSQSQLWDWYHKQWKIRQRLAWDQSAHSKLRWEAASGRIETEVAPQEAVVDDRSQWEVEEDYLCSRSRPRKAKRNKKQQRNHWEKRRRKERKAHRALKASVQYC